MKKILFLMVAVVWTMVWSSVTYADNCDQARNTYDDIYCTNKVYASADAELNKNYQLLRAKLNSNQKAILKTSQLSWIRERNHWLRERVRECTTIGCKTSALH